MFYLHCYCTDFFFCHGLQNTRHSLTGPSPEYRLKEKYFLRKIEINNLDDTEGNKYKIFKNNFVRMILTFRAVSQYWLTQFDIKMMILFWHSAPNLTFQSKLLLLEALLKGEGGAFMSLYFEFQILSFQFQPSYVSFVVISADLYVPGSRPCRLSVFYFTFYLLRPCKWYIYNNWIIPCLLIG